MSYQQPPDHEPGAAAGSASRRRRLPGPGRASRAPVVQRTRGPADATRTRMAGTPAPVSAAAAALRSASASLHLGLIRATVRLRDNRRTRASRSIHHSPMAGMSTSRRSRTASSPGLRPDLSGRPARTSWPRRHKVLTVLGGLAALIIIAGIASRQRRKRQEGQRRFHRRHHHAHPHGHTQPGADAPRDEKEDKAEENPGDRERDHPGASSNCSRRRGGASTGNCSRGRAVIFSRCGARGLPPADQRG